jgi:hypothetical protein
MKRALTASIAVNVVLAALVFWRTKPEAADPIGSAAMRPVSSPASSTSRAPEPFHWSQLESADYRRYIANLRRIGCPEATIRDIITADAHSLYERRRQEILKRPGREVLSLAEKVELETELSMLAREEAGLISTLLGDDLNRTPSAGALADGRSLRPTRTRSNVPPELPLVFREPPGSLELDAQQSEVIDYLRQRFREELGPENDPGEPAYAERWKSAQQNSDDLLTGLLGGEFYLNYQLQTSDRESTR